MQVCGIGALFLCLLGILGFFVMNR
jgi:hypothetical protein